MYRCVCKGVTQAGETSQQHQALSKLFSHSYPTIHLCECLQILENTAFRKLATTRSAAISLVEHRRAHNICIELSGIRMPFENIKVGRPAFKMQ